jgi:DNA processing protein
MGSLVRGDVASAGADPALLPPGWPDGFGADADQRDALLVLASLRGITPRSLRELAWREGGPRACLAAIRRGAGGSAADRAHAATIRPAEVDAAIAACHGRCLGFHDPAYPDALRDLQRDAPGWVFVRGRGFAEPGVAVVGARKCSALGRDVARDLGRRVAAADLAVVSGAAYGIDAAAHEGALAAGGPTIAVLGSGIDVAYPRSSRRLIERIAAEHTLVSEYPPGTPAEPHRFPARNRIIAGLARALVVVEGEAESGSRISVDHALDLGREVFAVPGPVTSPLAEAPLAMIRDGATLIRGADDLLADLGVAIPGGARARSRPPPDLSGEELRAWEALGDGALPDLVARQLGRSIPDAVALLIGLELRGLVRSVGGRYERTLGG